MSFSPKKPTNIFGRIIYKFFETDRIWSLLTSTVLLFLLKLGILRSVSWWDLLTSPSFTIVLFFVMYASEVHFEDYVNKKHSFEVKINTDTELEFVRGTKILHRYYTHLVLSITDIAKELHRTKRIGIEPHTLYNHIIFSTKEFEESLVSIDYDLDAWFYVCEEEDFEHFVSAYGKEQEFITLRQMYKDNKVARRRIDLTYNISKILIDRFDAGILPDVKRIIFLPNQKYGMKEAIILRALWRINDHTSGKIHNKVLFGNAVNKDQKVKLDFLQDIVAFDHNIAYKEYLRSDTDNESEILIKTSTVENVYDQFIYLFNSKIAGDIKI